MEKKNEAKLEWVKWDFVVGFTLDTYHKFMTALAVHDALQLLERWAKVIWWNFEWSAADSL